MLSKMWINLECGREHRGAAGAHVTRALWGDCVYSDCVGALVSGALWGDCVYSDCAARSLLELFGETVYIQIVLARSLVELFGETAYIQIVLRARYWSSLGRLRIFRLCCALVTGALWADCIYSDCALCSLLELFGQTAYIQIDRKSTRLNSSHPL
jgi:hypothetical protein